jgi:hypothetical protein
MLPIPNPACLAKPVKDVIERIIKPQGGASLWPWFLLLALVALRKKGK